MERPTAVAEQPELKRVMGPGLLLLFIVGDILGTGVYALTGEVAGEVGGAAWVPFLVAFLSRRSPRSAIWSSSQVPAGRGAALYTHKAFGMHFVTFLVAFTVMCSGITSASTASQVLRRELLRRLRPRLGHSGGRARTAVHDAARGGELARRRREREVQRRAHPRRDQRPAARDRGRLVGVRSGRRRRLRPGGRVRHDRRQERVPRRHGGTSLAFFAMVGFEDSVNMAEETKDPGRIFPKVMLSGLAITGVVYVVVVDRRGRAGTVDTLGRQRHPADRGRQVGRAGPADRDILPFITMFAVANSALINMLMASRLLYGMARQHVLPPVARQACTRRRRPGWRSSSPR